MKRLKLLLKNIKYILSNDLSKYPSAYISYENIVETDKNDKVKKYTGQ